MIFMKGNIHQGMCKKLRETFSSNEKTRKKERGREFGREVVLLQGDATSPLKCWKKLGHNPSLSMGGASKSKYITK